MRLAETHIVPENISDVRLSDYVKGVFDVIPSKKGMKKAIDKGYVFVNEEESSTGRYICSNDKIELFLPEDFKKSYELKVEVVYEDDALAIVNKPAGLLTNGNAFKTLENTLSFNLAISSAPDALIWPEVTHRLDFPTSGLVIVAKTRSSNVKLKQMFEQREVRKTYHAITIGQIRNRKGLIDHDIDAKNASSEFEVVKSVPSGKYKFFNLVKLKPHTGRRHQLRIHLASIGHPILGDREHGTSKHWDMKRGLYLAATGLEFSHPSTDKVLNLAIDIPKKFYKLLGISDKLGE